jgi:[ribosomal protein S18]-alanine N-acetyltransferase
MQSLNLTKFPPVPETNETITLSNLLASDAQVISALHKRCFAQPWTTADFSRFARAQECHGVVARIGGAVAGFIVIRIVEEEAEVLTLAVDGPWRRHGVASAVLEQAMTTAAKRGATTLFLEVGVRNDAARALYKVLGFIRAGRRSRYYTTPDGPEDALVMKCDLMSVPLRQFVDVSLHSISVNSAE